MNKILLSLLACGVILVTTNNAIAKTEILVEKNGNITNYYAKDDPIRYAREVQSLPDKEKAALFEYAKANPGKVKPVVYIALADYVFETNKSEALFWYFAGRIRATSDIAMCEDTSARAKVSIYPMLAPRTMEYGLEHKWLVKKVVKKALKWDEENKERIHPEWACYHGMMVFMLNGEVTTKDMSEYENVQKEMRDYMRQKL